MHPLSALHAEDAKDYERYGEQLPHVEWERGFECLLHFLGVFYEEAGGEDIRQTESEEESRAYFLRIATVEIPADKEKQGIGDSLIELPGVARLHVHLFEDESPRHIGYSADYLGVHQIAQSDEACRDGGGDGDIVEHLPDWELCAPYIQEEGDHQSQCSTVACQSGIACEFPSAVFKEADGEQHLDDVFARGEEVVGFIEETVSQSCSDENADEAVDKERIEQFVFYLLLFVEFPHDEISRQQSDEPAQCIPAHGYWSEMECFDVWIPVYHIFD